MKRKLLTAILVVTLAGCEPVPRPPDHELSLTEPQGTVCYRGVVYYQYINSIAPAFKPDGTLYTCGYVYTYMDPKYDLSCPKPGKAKP
jgi:hypothetical protein